MDKIVIKIKEYLNSFSKHTCINIGLFLIPLIGIVIKGICLQGFIQNQDPYNFDFMIGYSNSQYTLSYYIAFTLIFLSFGLLFKGKGRVIYLLIIDAFLTALTLLDVMYFRGFLTVPSVLILTQTANLDNLGGSIYSMLSSYDYIFFLDFIVFGLYIFFTRKSYKHTTKRAYKTFCLAFILPILYIGYIPFNLNVLKNEDVSGAYLFDSYDPTNTCKYFSSAGYHIIDLYTVYRDSKPYTLTDEEKSQVESYYQWKKEDLTDNEYAGISEGKNLIVIQVESLESFVINQSINGQEVTPVLNNIVNNNGVYFPNIYEQVNEGTSADSDLMINTSMLPLRRGCTFFRYPNATYNSVPKILGEEGYEAISIHPDKGSFWNYANALQGGIAFPNFKDQSSFNLDEQIGMGLSDKSYFEQVVPMLKELNSPFYAHTITLTSHGPFDLPEEYRKLSLDSELGSSELGGYLESIHYTDAQIGYFLDSLNKANLLENSTIVIVGDHTGVHKYYNSSIENLSNAPEWCKYDGEPVVPFIIYDKSLTSGTTLDTIGGQIDIMPTMLYMLGVDNSKYANSALGRNLLNTERNYSIITNGTIKGTDLTSEDEEQLKNILELSDKMIRADYFNTSK